MTSMKVPSGAKADAVKAFEQANVKAGLHAHDIGAQASAFFKDFDDGGMRKETKLKLRLLVDPSQSTAIQELRSILVFTQPGEGVRHDRLDGWLAQNKNLVGWMSGKTQAMLKDVAARGDDGRAIQREATRAAVAIHTAFGMPPADRRALAGTALQTLASEAHVEGLTQGRYRDDVPQLAGKLARMFAPGAQKALQELSAALADPSASNEVRFKRLQGWEHAHPTLVQALDQNQLAGIHHDLRVGDWSDANFRNARELVFTAFEQAGRS